MPDLEIKVIGYPQRVYEFTYGESYIFYAISRHKVISVNEDGATVLNFARDYQEVDEIIAKCAEKYHSSPEEVRPGVISFLNEMIAAGFLYAGGNEVEKETIPDSVLKAEVKLKRLYLHLTNECNQECRYCYNQTFRTANDHKTELTLAEFEEIIQEFSDIGGESIVFTGGEPLLSPYLLKLAAQAKKIGLRTNLLTNGTLCTKENAPDICKNFDLIVVSLDSKHQEEHDYLRGSHTYAQTVAGIKALSNLLRENPSLETKLECRPVINRENIDHILDYPQFITEELGCFRAFPTAYVPNDLSEFNNGLFLPFQELLPTLLQFHAKMAQLGGTVENDLLKLQRLPRCGACSSIISIAPDGSIYPCQSLHYSDLVVGNAREGRLDQIVARSPVSRFFQEFHYSQIPICKECPLGPICGGGCRALAYTYYHDLHAHNEIYCPFFRQKLEFGLWQKTLRDSWEQESLSRAGEEQRTRESDYCS